MTRQTRGDRANHRRGESAASEERWTDHLIGLPLSPLSLSAEKTEERFSTAAAMASFMTFGPVGCACITAAICSWVSISVRCPSRINCLAIRTDRSGQSLELKISAQPNGDLPQDWKTM